MSMYVTTVSLLNPWLATRQPTNNGTGYMGQIGSALGRIAPGVARTFDGWLHIVVGFVGFIWGSIGSTFFKDNTAMDWLSKIGMVVGAVFSGMGIYKLYQYNKSSTPETLPSHFQLNSKLEKDLKTTLGKLLDVDPNFKKLNWTSSSICRNSVDQSLRPAILELFKLRIHDDFKNKIAGYSGGANLVIDNANGPKEPLNLQELKDSLAVLVGDIVGLRADDSADFYKDLVDTHLKDTDVESLLKDSDIRNCKCELLRLLPEDFNLVYAVARFYDKNHNQTNQENSIINRFNRNVQQDLEVKLARPGRKNKADLDYLSEFENTYNYLKVLRQAITYVSSVEGQQAGAIDVTRARNAAILRHALVTAFRLKGKDLSEIHEQLDKILRGDPTNTGDKKGLEAKIKEMDNYFTQIQEMVNRNKTQISYDPQELIYGGIFPTSINLIKFKEMKPLPAA